MKKNFILLLNKYDTVSEKVTTTKQQKTFISEAQITTLLHMSREKKKHI